MKWLGTWGGILLAGAEIEALARRAKFAHQPEALLFCATT